MIAAIRCRNQLRRNYYTSKEPNDWENYRQQRNRVVSLRRKAIKEYLAQQCSTSNGNPTEFWDVFKPFMFSRKSCMTESIQLSEDTNIIQDKRQIANILNTHFLSIAIPSMENYKDHVSISGIKDNFTPAEEFNFKLVTKIQVEDDY